MKCFLCTEEGLRGADERYPGLSCAKTIFDRAGCNITPIELLTISLLSPSSTRNAISLIAASGPMDNGTGMGQVNIPVKLDPRCPG